MLKSIPLATLGLFGVFAIAACGGSSAPSTSLAGVPVDNCLIGNWSSSNVSGSLTSGTTAGSFSGGSGEKVKIQADGTLSVDDSLTQPIIVAFSDGTSQKLQQSGTGTGKVTTSGTQFTVSLDSGSAQTLTTKKFGPDGQPTGTPAPASGFTATYMCTPGHSFSFTVNGETFEFAPS